MKIFGKFILLISYFSLVIAQNQQSLELPQIEESNTPILYREYGVVPLALEHPVDPETYFLGPGDRLRINITSGLFEESISKEWSVENIDNFVIIDPTGVLFIPKIGPINVLGKSLAEIERELDERKGKVYKEAIISVTLIRFRQFKVLVHGAFNNPKFVKITPVSRLMDAVNGAGGIQKYADPNKIILIRDGKERNYFLKEFLLNGDLGNNPLLTEGDIIYAPFLNIDKEEQMNLTEYNRNKITITGFVRRPTILNYIPGYKVKDYIAMSGGALDIGSAFRTKIIRADGKIIRFANDEYVGPGDIIEIPELYTSILFGNTGFIQALTSIATLILAYQATI